MNCPLLVYAGSRTLRRGLGGSSLRVHLDLITTDIDGEAERLINLGATVVNTITGQAHWITFADPEGNEFDLVSG
ncbi:VOC family protein [Nocardioides sp.]|uniref:VOC family protein n=1 Tax=Nocardioides sp. TaxID=35761 RepID=UPI0031FEF983|nr:glyoxalase/bleomycin resistance/dioxygenase family protein [Nocardioides sp.]